VSDSKVFIRSSRRWMKQLAEAMRWKYQKDNHREMYNITSENNFLFKLKRSPLPPLEWFIPYSILVSRKDLKSVEVIIEPGSRLINTSKKYICYCENGLGIFSYNNKKVNIFNKWLAKRLINRHNFIGFVFYSESSRIAAYSILGDSIKSKDLGVIYPLSKNELNSKDVSVEKETSCLTFGFCSSLFILKGGRELVDAILAFNNSNPVKVKLNLLTRTNDIPESYLNKIIQSDYLSITEFNLSEDEYIKHVRSWDVYVHPSFFDSCPLTVIEMSNFGKPIIASKIFAIPELINSNSAILIDDVNNTFNSSTYLPDDNVFLDELILQLSKPSSEYSEKLVKLLNNSFLNMINNFDTYKVEAEKFKGDDTYMCSPNFIKDKWRNILGGSLVK
jgi:glycosyltransferase involved in cell wall biosynthesis